MNERGSITNYSAQETLPAKCFDLSKVVILREGETFDIAGPAHVAVMSGQEFRRIWVMSSATMAGPLLHMPPEPAEPDEVIAATARVVRRNLELLLMLVVMIAAIAWLILAMTLGLPGPVEVLTSWGMAISGGLGAPDGDPRKPFLIGVGILALCVTAIGAFGLPLLARYAAGALTDEAPKA